MLSLLLLSILVHVVTEKVRRHSINVILHANDLVFGETMEVLRGKGEKGGNKF